MAKCTSSMPSRMPRTTRSPDWVPEGRSTWVTSPVTTTLEPKPNRVRNIFICSAEVFCASSRMMKASLSVRPRMYASGAISMVPALISRGIESGSSMSCSASYSGRKYGSVSYTHLRAHETRHDLVCRLLLEKKKKKKYKTNINIKYTKKTTNLITQQNKH